MTKLIIAKKKVVGSNPIFRSILLAKVGDSPLALFERTPSSNTYTN